MKVVTKYPDGVFSWIDLATTDLEGAIAFYSGLFGWQAVEVPTGESMAYYMFTIEGHNVAGMGALSPEMQAQGVPPMWSSYINHSDIDGVAARTAAAGGQVTLPPMDVMEAGRMLMIMDPSGSHVGVWEAKDHIGAQLVNQPNTLVWNELQTRDKKAASEFYEAVFGWTYFDDQSGYRVCQADGRTQAGIMEMDENWDENIPPNWSAYILVEDVQAKAGKVKELGGQVMVPPTPAGEMGTFSIVSDPQGAIFTIMQFNGPVDPPPGHD